MESEFKLDILDYLSLSLPSTLDESWFSSIFWNFDYFTLSNYLNVKEPLSDRNSWEPLVPILRPTLSSFFAGILKSLYLLAKLSLLELQSYYFVSEILSPPSNNYLPDNERWSFLY